MFFIIESMRDKRNYAPHKKQHLKRSHILLHVQGWHAFRTKYLEKFNIWIVHF